MITFENVPLKNELSSYFLESQINQQKSSLTVKYTLFTRKQS